MSQSHELPRMPDETDAAYVERRERFRAAVVRFEQASAALAAADVPVDTEMLADDEAVVVEDFMRDR